MIDTSSRNLPQEPRDRRRYFHTPPRSPILMPAHSFVRTRALPGSKLATPYSPIGGQDSRMACTVSAQLTGWLLQGLLGDSLIPNFGYGPRMEVEMDRFEGQNSPESPLVLTLLFESVFSSLSYSKGPNHFLSASLELFEPASNKLLTARFKFRDFRDLLARSSASCRLSCLFSLVTLWK